MVIVPFVLFLNSRTILWSIRVQSYNLLYRIFLIKSIRVTRVEIRTDVHL